METIPARREDTGAAAARGKRALLIAYHYPPCQESSGYLRALAFSRYLPRFGWNPVVLTASERAYSKVDPKQCERIPKTVPVVRAFARDAREHLSISHKYPSLLGVPDRCSSWWLGATPVGLSLIRRYRPQVLWATQPNPTAFWIAHTLHRLTGVPWIADFRDPIGEGDSRLAARVCHWIERKTVSSCSRAVFTAEGAAAAYAARFPEIPADRWTIISNGYDEADFDFIEGDMPASAGRPLRLIHSGALYPEGRDPRALFTAICRLKQSGQLSSNEATIVFRAAGSEGYYRELLEQADIADIVQLRPSIPYKQALAELFAADGLLVLQGGIHSGQIPAKIYEYMRSRRPIMALTDPAGNTAQALRDAGLNTIAPIDRANEIAVALMNFIAKIRAGEAAVASDAAIARHTREAGARQLARLFDEIAADQLEAAAGGY
ncbi:MAG TPA: glycosyltransferase [Gammaproteobacteria bacterium]|nr:glycosyltransferase [Gammaproteobacteria bacterium]